MKGILSYSSLALFFIFSAIQEISTKECTQPLGMQGGMITDVQITASSQYSTRHAARNARLNLTTSPGSWSSLYKDSSQWLQVVFNTETTVTGIATQGRYPTSANRTQWVTRYTLMLKTEGESFQSYKQAETPKIFQGNNDSNTIVYHQLNPPIRSSYIRVCPVEWEQHISMRIELYGCHDGCRELRFTTFIAGKVLRNHVIRSVEVLDEHLCGAKCYSENMCVSYNIEEGSGGLQKCELNNATDVEYPQDLEAREDSFYRGTLNACGSNPCKNNGTCQSGFSSKQYQCRCQKGFFGAQCEIDADECASNPCLNGGTCKDLIDSYICICPIGADGTHCEEDIDECASKPCQNGGTCSDLVNDFNCSCYPGYTGKVCEEVPEECRSYTNLTEKNRHRSAGQGNDHCDINLNGWHRFVGEAGTKMLDKCLESKKACGSAIPGYIDQSHPTAEQGLVSRNVCFYHNLCGVHCKRIRVRKCATFFVYELKTEIIYQCPARYCGVD